MNKQLLRFSLRFLFALTFILSLPALLSAQVADKERALREKFENGVLTAGLRAGWDGAPNGFSVYRKLNARLGLEMLVGYNDKEGRRMPGSYAKKGNTMLRMSMTPYLFPDRRRSVAVVYGSFGAGARLHHYRMRKMSENARSAEPRPSPITADLHSGIGMIIRPIPRIEGFIDIHIVYYNNLANANMLGTESGVGIRVGLY